MQPTWPTAIGNTAPDGGVVWTDRGPNVPAFVIDPRGLTAPTPLPLTFGIPTLPRISLFNTPADVFLWHDDLNFVLPKDMTTPQNGNRPAWPNGVPQIEGNFSWFLMVAPSPTDAAAGLAWNLRHQFSVAVVVCWKRGFNLALPNPDEATVTVLCDNAIGQEHLIAFCRGQQVAVLAPRWNLRLGSGFGATSVELPAGRWTKIFSGEEVSGGKMRVQNLLQRFPVALLVRGAEANHV